MTVQSTQLLHLAEETSDLAQDGGLSKDTTDNVWDAKFNKIKNLLDPTDPGDAVTLNYITKNQDSLLTQLRNTGAAQNSSIVSTGDSQNARLTSTGDTQNTRLNTTGDTQDKRLNDLGQKYVDLMTTLKDTATTKATEASNSAELSKKWAMSDTSPDGVTGNKSSKTWAGEAKTSASNANASASASQSSANASSASATQSANSASASKSSANASASSASAASSSASAASTSAFNAKTSETNAANSAAAAKQSEENAKTWDPTQYVKMENVKSIIKSMLLSAFPVGTIIESMNDVNPSTYIGGVWEKLPAGYVTISAGTYTENHDGTPQSYTYAAGNTYGEVAHKLTTEEMPSHNHRNMNPLSGNGTAGYATTVHVVRTHWEGEYEKSIRIDMENTGGNQYHNNLPPSLAVYRFKRIT